VGRPNKSHDKRTPKPDLPPAAPADEKRVTAEVRSLAEVLCDSEGIELVHVEFLRDRGGRVLRLFIDKPTGVTLEDCATVSRELGDVLDVHLPDIGRYHLEVSSPGPNRPLSRAEDFERFRGHTAKIRTLYPMDGQRHFSGVLAGISGRAVCLVNGQTTVTIPLEDISKAHLVNHTEKAHVDFGNQTGR